MGDLTIHGAAFLFGFASAIFPLFNAEAYVVGLGSLVDSDGRLFIAVMALTIGTVVGKAIVFEAIRRGSERFRREPEERRIPRSRFGAMVRRVGDTMLEWMDRPVTGALVVFASSTFAVPPLAVVTIVSALSRQRLSTFLLMVFIGRTIQYLAIAFVIHHTFG